MYYPAYYEELLEWRSFQSFKRTVWKGWTDKRHQSYCGRYQSQIYGHPQRIWEKTENILLTYWSDWYRNRNNSIEKCTGCIEWDKQKWKETEFCYGTITGKYVIYSAEDKLVNGIQYLNVEKYLLNLWCSDEIIFIWTFSFSSVVFNVNEMWRIPIYLLFTKNFPVIY